MILYTKEHEEIDVDNQTENIINSGVCADVYHYQNNQCVKVYHEYTLKKHRIKEELFEVIKDKESSHFCKINELLYQRNSIQGQVMKYYQSTAQNILYNKIDYLLENMNGLEKEAIWFGEHFFEMKDMKRANSVVTDENIVLIDPDLYVKKRCSEIELYLISKEQIKFHLIRKNKLEILRLLKDIIDYYLTLSDETKKRNCYLKMKKLFSQSIEPQQTFTDETYQKLKKYTYPIDYFLD